MQITATSVNAMHLLYKHDLMYMKQTCILYYHSHTRQINDIFNTI